MEKDYKTLNKMYRKVEDPNLKNKLAALIDEMDSDTEENPKAENKEQEPAKEEQVKEGEPEEKPQEKEKQEIDMDSVLKRLEKVEALEKDITDLKKVATETFNKTEEVEKKVGKSKAVGAKPKQVEGDDDPEQNWNSVFERATARPQYTKE